MRIRINEKEYPTYVTMGAMLLYKDLTGKEIGEEESGASDMVVYMYCCARSASEREGVDFPFGSARDFANHVLPKDFTAWAESLGAEESGGAEKDKKK